MSGTFPGLLSNLEKLYQILLDMSSGYFKVFLCRQWMAPITQGHCKGLHKGGAQSFSFVINLPLEAGMCVSWSLVCTRYLGNGSNMETTLIFLLLAWGNDRDFPNSISSSFISSSPSRAPQKAGTKI